VSIGALGATVRALFRSPRRFVGALGVILADLPHRPKRVLKGLGLFPVMVWISEELKRQRIDHVHAHFASYPALAGMVLQKLGGTSYSFTAHAFDIYVDPSQLDAKIDHAAFVATSSDYNRRLLARRSTRGTPVHVVRCGVRVPESLPELHNGPTTVLCVGRLVEKKGQAYLIDACAMLRGKGFDVQCMMIGDGPDRDLLQQRIDATGLTGHVKLAGSRTTDEVASALRQATVFVLPSIVTGSGNAEGLPLALEEAMAAGVPVLSTRVTGIPELVDDGVNGVLVDPGDASQLAAALERLITSPAERERLRKAAFETIRNEFGLLDNARKLSGYLEDALESGKPKRRESVDCP
jgi:glycosyltransferase involved in cell wall biosynthesis